LILLLDSTVALLHLINIDDWDNMLERKIVRKERMATRQREEDEENEEEEEGGTRTITRSAFSLWVSICDRKQRKFEDTPRTPGMMKFNVH